MPGRTIHNVHERELAAPAAAIGELMETLSSPTDRLWPYGRWPAMRLDNGLEPGSNGGHGPVRYAVARHEPGRLVAFAFTAKFPILGEHRFELLGGPDIPDADNAPGAQDRGPTLARHTLEGRPAGWMRLAWPLLFRWLHDALIEDAFDRATAELKGATWQPRPLPAHVRALRWAARRLARRQRSRSWRST